MNTSILHLFTNYVRNPLFFSAISSVFSSVALWLSFVVVAVCSLSPSLSAGTVQYLGGIDQAPLHTASNQPIAEGYAVAIGTFTDGFNPTSSANDFSTLLANWHEFDRTFVRTLAGRDGSFAGQGINTTPFFAGKKIYLLALRTRNGELPLADASNVLDYGFFSSSHSAWVFPPSGARPPLDLTQINTSQINESLWGRLQETVVQPTPVVEPGTEPNPVVTPTTVTVPVLVAKEGVSVGELTWQNWIDRVFTVDSSAIVKSRTADPAGTGKPNFFYFALNQNPFEKKDFPLSVVDSPSRNSSQNLAMNYTRTKFELSTLQTFAEYSTDLVNWQPASETVLSSDTETETVQATASLSGGKVFFRVKVRE